MSRFVSWWVALALLGGGVPAAQAQAPVQDEPRAVGRGQGWSVLGGQTVGVGSDVLVAQMGWPGVALGLLHGQRPRLDLGGRFSFNYGEQRLVERTDPGLKVQGWLRYTLLERERFNLGLTFAPGPFFSFRESDTLVGLELPVALSLGIPVGSALVLHAGLDVPFFVVFGSGGGPVFQMLVGGGFEYFIDRRLAGTFHVRMGPSLAGSDGGRRPLYDEDAEFALEALFGIAYKL